MFTLEDRIFGFGDIVVYGGSGAPSSTDGVEAGNWYVDEDTGALYRFDGSSWIAPAGNDSVTPAQFGPSVVNGRTEGGIYQTIVPIPASALDGTANSILEVPQGCNVIDVSLILAEVAGEACTINVGTDDSNWELHNDDPDAFIEAFDANSAFNAVSMRMLDEANQAAAAISGGITSTGAGNIIATSSADVSASDISVICKVTIAKLDTSIFEN